MQANAESQERGFNAEADVRLVMLHENAVKVVQLLSDQTQKMTATMDLKLLDIPEFE